MGNAISNLAGGIQVTNEAVQKTARQSVCRASATAASTAGASTISPGDLWTHLDLVK